MITEELMYWITRLDHVLEMARGALMINSIVFVVAAIVLLLNMDLDNGNNSKQTPCKKGMEPSQDQLKLKRYMGIAIWASGLVVIASSLVMTFVPTTREMAAIKVIPAMANSDGLREIGEDLQRLAKEWIEELHPKKKEH